MLRVHLPSLAVGAVVVVAVVLLLGMGVSPTPEVVALTTRFQYVPDPREVVNVVEGSPFVVPTGKSLIITDWTVSDPRVALSPTLPLSIEPRIRVDGADRWAGGFGSASSLPSPGASAGSAATGGGFLGGSLFSGVRAEAGQVVTIAANANYLGPLMFAAGYLSSAQQPQNVVRVRYIPSPNDLVNIESGAPYMVPAGKVLILTDWACADAKVVGWSGQFSLAPRIRVDGVDRWAGGFDQRTNFSGQGGTYTAETTAGGSLTGTLISGIRADSGQVVTLEFGEGGAGTKLFASGYLAKANP